MLVPRLRLGTPVARLRLALNVSDWQIVAQVNKLFGVTGLRGMATQRLMVATLVGQSAIAVAARFDQWRSAPDSAAVDRLVALLREHALSLPVVYFSEWVDRWLMGDLVPGPGAVDGCQFQATCLTPAQAIEWAKRCENQFAEQGWLASRLREAASGWGGLAEPRAVVVVREVVGVSDTDDAVQAVAGMVPPWLASPVKDAAPDPCRNLGSEGS